MLLYPEPGECSVMEPAEEAGGGLWEAGSPHGYEVLEGLETNGKTNRNE